MNSLTVGQHTSSKRRFWWLAAVWMPLFATALPIFGVLVGGRGGGWAIADALLLPAAVLVLATAPGVRELPAGPRAAWTLLGVLVALVVGTVLAAVVAFSALYVACHAGGCFS